MATFEFKTKVHVDDDGREWIQPPVLGTRHIVRGTTSAREDTVVKLAKMEHVLQVAQTAALVYPGGTLYLADYPALVAVNAATVRTFRVDMDLSLRKASAR